MEEKVEHAKKLIEDAVRNYPRVAVACSFGKIPATAGGECGIHAQRLK